MLKVFSLINRFTYNCINKKHKSQKYNYNFSIHVNTDYKDRKVIQRVHPIVDLGESNTQVKISSQKLNQWYKGHFTMEGWNDLRHIFWPRLSSPTSLQGH